MTIYGALCGCGIQYRKEVEYMIYTKTLNEGDECYIWVGDMNSASTFAGRVPPLTKLRATFRNGIFITPSNEIYGSSVWKFTKIPKKMLRVKRTHENTITPK